MICMRLRRLSASLSGYDSRWTARLLPRRTSFSLLLRVAAGNRVSISTTHHLDPERYTVAWIAPLEIEARAALCLFDEVHDGCFPVSRGQDFIFSAGSVCGHNVVLATLPPGHPYGTGSAGALAAQIKMVFPHLWFGLLVGVAAGLPDLSLSPPRDIRLGDVLVALPEGDSAGLIAYDLGKELGENEFRMLHGGHALARTEAIVRSAIGKIKLKAPHDTDVFLHYYQHIQGLGHADGTFVDPGQEKDILYELGEVVQRPPRPHANRTRVWYGAIGSGEKLMRDATKRNQLRDQHGIIGLEMEAAGTMNTLPVGVIRGVCDYADRHKNKDWQPYAAAMAAAYAKAILHTIAPKKVQGAKALTPSKSIPFFRDPDFVHRSELLDQMAQRCAEPPSRVALVGLGGVGKSQLAVEFAYQFSEGTDMWVFWINASTRARVEESFRTIAETVELPGKDQPKADIPHLLYNWLSNERNGRWVMILDGADDSDVFYQIHRDLDMPLASFLPQSQNGSIIVTTRDRSLAFRLTGHQRNVIDVGPMAESDALVLLDRKLGSAAADAEIARELVHALGLIPLAISQAGAYMQAQERRSSPAKYLAKFRKNEREKAWLLKHDAGDLRRYGYASNSILTTWQISFEHIRQKRPAAADLLSFMSFCDGQGIPEYLLAPSSSDKLLDAKGTESSSANDTFDDDMAILGAYCLVASTKGDEDVFEMHRLVQLSTRNWLAAEGLEEKFKGQFVRRMAASFPAVGADSDGWAICEALFPHVEAAMAHRPYDDGLEEWASLLHKGACFALLQGRLHVAEQMARKSMEACLERRGEEDLDSLLSMGLLALVITDQGRWEESEKLQRRVIEISRAKFGADHPNTLYGINNLASTYQEQGKLREAEVLQLQIMNAHKAKFGAEHPETLSSMNNLALTYQGQGKLEAAEALQLQVMDTRKSKLGADHPDTLIHMHNLALTYFHQGRWEEAETLQARALETGKSRFGTEHPDVLASMNSLAQTYQKQCRWKEAETLQREVMHTFETKFGVDNPDTLTAMNLLASNLKGQGRNGEALALMSQCAQAQQRVLGPQHPSTLSSLATVEEWTQAGPEREP